MEEGQNAARLNLLKKSEGSLMSSYAELALDLYTSHQRGHTFKPVQSGAGPLSTSAAYAIQDELIALMTAELSHAVVGYKIGLTSQAMQLMCGISSPVYGQILRAGLLPGGAYIDPANFGHLGIEFEIAVRISKDVNVLPKTLQEMANYVDAVCPAFELIDDRHANYSMLDASSLIADNAWNAGVVLGQWQALPANLQTLEGRIFVDGVQVDSAQVGAALNHPLESVWWLSAELARQGKQLQAGMMVMTGSIVKTRFPVQGQQWRYAVEGLGEVTANFGSREVQ